MDAMATGAATAAATRARSADAAAGYRGDIDGLRALAVVAVVAFHAGVPGFAGGFAGVDMFFVISGYLIGGIVHREIAAGRFSFAAFYARRARRILPALIAVSLATLALGVVLLGPGELKRFAISAAAALIGVSNLWFFHATDYFAPDARLEPFLMTWSLGIEEQFYLLLPPLLMLSRRWRTTAVLKIVLAVTAGSLLLSVLATPLRPVAAFYSLPTRAWELGIGVGLAMAREGGFGLADRAQRWIAVIGMAGLVAALVLLDERMRFPGYVALMPTVATAMLIATPASSINRHFLGSRPMVAIGLISYSWYLWHWPLLALARICAAVPVSGWLTAVVGFGAIAPAYLSWRWIEQPFRHAAPGRSARVILSCYAAAVGVCLALLAGVVVTGGLPARVGPIGMKVDTMLGASKGGPCLAGYGVAVPNLTPACAPVGGRPLIALLGDSHAAALGDTLRDRAKAHGFEVLQLTAASCPPLLGATLRLPRHPGASQACAAFNAAAITRAANDPRVKLVVITGFWQSPFSVLAVAGGEGVIDVDPRFRGRSSAEELAIALTRTLARFRGAGKRVLLLGDTPWLRFDPALHVWTRFLPARAALEQGIAPGLADDGGIVSRALVDPLDDRGARIVAASAAAVPGVRVAHLRDLLCDAERCRVGEGATPFFIDPQHLSRAGADHVVARLDRDLWRLTE